MAAVINYALPFVECTYCKGRIQKFGTFNEEYFDANGDLQTRSVTSTTIVDSAANASAFTAHRATPCSSGTPNYDDATNITAYPTNSPGTTNKTEPPEATLDRTSVNATTTATQAAPGTAGANTGVPYEFKIIALDSAKDGTVNELLATTGTVTAVFLLKNDATADTAKLMLAKTGTSFALVGAAGTDFSAAGATIVLPTAVDGDCFPVWQGRLENAEIRLSCTAQTGKKVRLLVWKE